MTTNCIVLESEVLGKVTLPRDKVSSMTFGAGSTTSATAVVPSFTNSAPSAKRAANAFRDKYRRHRRPASHGRQHEFHSTGSASKC